MSDYDFSGSSESKLARAIEDIARIREQIGRAMIGQQQAVDQVLTSFLAAGHVLIQGVPGVGKTLLVLALARSFGGKFSRVQFTTDLMPSDVIGHAVLDMRSGSFTIRQGPAFTNLLLADEINRDPAKTQSALLEVMQERQITIEGESFPLPAPFMTFATQNPIELEGTYPLPEAQLDRFLLQVRIDYPTEAEEREILQTTTSRHTGDTLDVSRVETLFGAERVVELQRASAEVVVEERVQDYALRIARATRDWPGVAIGAGPRGSIAVVRAARAAALLAGRDYVVPDDIKQMALPALRHRLVLAADLEMEGQTADSILAQIFEQIEAPRQ
jgi:MoxR-like ATPase